MNLDVASGESRRTIATTERYADAEAIVDRLADTRFPVEHVSGLLHDQVTGWVSKQPSRLG